MKKTALLFVPVLAGCLGSAPKPPVNWTIDIESDAKVAFAAVCAPYGGQRIAVLRPDGSIAFDPCNAFAAAPGSIIKDAVVGRKGEGSLFVRKLALDCRAEGRRDAVVSLEIVSGDRVGKGEATELTSDGNYSAAFSRAFSRAYANALEELKHKK
ncbi:MAG: hypothetical protein II840_09030 [Kiritimatiellae bacterium]|nr:hypothetical protein [Kiritimatiellia bacterium]